MRAFRFALVARGEIDQGGIVLGELLDGGFADAIAAARDYDRLAGEVSDLGFRGPGVDFGVEVAHD